MFINLLRTYSKLRQHALSIEKVWVATGVGGWGWSDIDLGMTMCIGNPTNKSAPKPAAGETYSPDLTGIPQLKKKATQTKPPSLHQGNTAAEFLMRSLGESIFFYGLFDFHRYLARPWLIVRLFEQHWFLLLQHWDDEVIVFCHVIEVFVKATWRL